MTSQPQESQAQTIFIALLGSFILLFVLMAWLLFPTRSSKTTSIPTAPTTIPTATPADTSTKENNADYLFTIQIPDTWKFNGQVLANYDIFNGEQLPSFPKGSIKCDFVNYDLAENIKLTESFLDEEVQVKKGMIVFPDSDPGGGGEYIYFLIQKAGLSRGLVCFAYDVTKEPDFKQILSTFKFIPVEGSFCGGIAANLPENQCPEGYTCKLDGNSPDAGGKCLKN